MSNTLGRRSRQDALQQGSRKKQSVFLLLISFFGHHCYRRTTSDPLVHSGRHFGRTIFAFSNVRTLITNGLSRRVEDVQLESLTSL
jgi:hypothetical protein